MKTTKYYLCGVDYQHEMEEGLANFYVSVETLKSSKNCWKQCGIVELELDEEDNQVSHKWIVEQNLFEENN